MPTATINVHPVGDRIPMSRLLANKNARIVWAMLSGGTFYEHAPSVKAA
jgi:hypothetical protein